MKQKKVFQTKNLIMSSNYKKCVLTNDGICRCQSHEHYISSIHPKNINFSWT